MSLPSSTYNLGGIDVYSAYGVSGIHFVSTDLSIRVGNSMALTICFSALFVSAKAYYRAASKIAPILPLILCIEHSLLIVGRFRGPVTSPYAFAGESPKKITPADFRLPSLTWLLPHSSL